MSRLSAPAPPDQKQAETTDKNSLHRAKMELWIFIPVCDAAKLCGRVCELHVNPHHRDYCESLVGLLTRRKHSFILNYFFLITP